jgi:hypothetical protein
VKRSEYRIYEGDRRLCAAYSANPIAIGTEAAQNRPNVVVAFP